MSFHSAIPGARDFALAPPTLAQSRLYRDSLQAMGRDLRLLRLGAHGRATLILRRAGPLGALALMPGGPRWRQDATITERRDALRDLPRLLRRDGIGALLTNCATPLEATLLRAAGHLPLLTGGHEARIDLSRPEAARRAAMQGKWRNRLVRAETAGVTVTHRGFTLKRHRWLLEAEANQRRARRYRGLPLEFTLSAAETAPEQVQVFTASHAGRRLGAMLFLLHERAATYHIGHLTPEGRALSAHNLILWQAANRLAERGFVRLDLGPVETERETGLARFKLGSGASAVRRGASCLYTGLTAPLGRTVTAMAPRRFS